MILRRGHMASSAVTSPPLFGEDTLRAHLGNLAIAGPLTGSRLHTVPVAIEKGQSQVLGSSPAAFGMSAPP